MVCRPCRANEHEECPELARQADTELTATDKAGSHLCTCQHYASVDATIGKLNAAMARSISSGRAAAARLA